MLMECFLVVSKLFLPYFQAYLSLPEGTASVVGLVAMMTDHYNVMVCLQLMFLLGETAYSLSLSLYNFWSPVLPHLF